MRLIHTADWHLGRRLKGIDRTPEIEHALNFLLADARALEVDAVLVAGDLFDAPNPPAEAERVAFQFFTDLQKAGIPAIVIAGNHDSASRVDGLSHLLALAGVTALGRPRRSGHGGVVRLETPAGTLKVGAMPFASERRLLTAEDLWDKTADEQRAHYREMVAHLMRDLASGFGDDTVNVLMAHVAFDSAKLAHSEAPFYTHGAYALSEAALPGAAQYVALGHIHTPQRIEAAAPTYYSGSLIQVDFGEAEEAKGYQLVTVEPGRPARVEFRTLACRRTLQVVHCAIDDLDALEAHRDEDRLYKVIVSLREPVVALADKVRSRCPNALVIEPRLPSAPKGEAQALDPSQHSPVEAYRRYYMERVGQMPTAAVEAAFEDMYEELAHAPA